MIVRAEYDAIISVRVPTLVACTVMADGEVVEPAGYAIENLSKVAVATKAITGSGQSPDTTVELIDGAQAVWSSASGGKGLRIAAEASKPLEWRVGNLDGRANAALLAEALAGPAKIIDVTFEFEEAA